MNNVKLQKTTRRKEEHQQKQQQHNTHRMNFVRME